MKAFVLDVSACMPWCCEDETTTASEEMLDWASNGSEMHVPSLWGWEILNAVGVAVKRRRITPDRAKEFLGQLAVLNFKIDESPRVSDFPRLHELATRHPTMSRILIWQNGCLCRWQLAIPTLRKRLHLRISSYSASNSK